METNLVISSISKIKLSEPYSNCRGDYLILDNKSASLKRYPYNPIECGLLVSNKELSRLCNQLDKFEMISNYYYTNESHFNIEYTSILLTCFHSNTKDVFDNYVKSEFILQNLNY